MQPIPDLAPHAPARAAAPTDRLREALLGLAGGQAALLSPRRERSWASVDLRRRPPPPRPSRSTATRAVAAGELFIAFLPEHEFTMPGHLVADAAVTEVAHQLAPPLLTVRCELLLLEEA